MRYILKLFFEYDLINLSILGGVIVLISILIKFLIYHKRYFKF